VCWSSSTGFTYSTGDTHVVSAVLQRATRPDTCRFAHRYLFGPMGITAEHGGGTREVSSPAGTTFI
jgi:CubicO group peptidase (beta-lactamase class C family)